MPRKIGLLHPGHKANFEVPLKALKKALPDDVDVDLKFAADLNQPIGKIADDLVHAATSGSNKLLALVAAGGPETAVLLRDKTKNLPNPPSIVFTTVTDPVELKLVARLEKPGGNLTGMAGQTSENDPVRLQMLVELGSGFTGARKIVKGDTIGVLLAYDRPGKVQQYRKVEEKAAELSLDLKLDPKDANDLADIEKHFEHFKKLSVKGVVVAADSLFNDLRADVVKIANKSGLPTIYQWRQFVDAGGLVSFGPDILQAYDMAGQYVTRILDGRETPATMECSTPDPSTFEVWMNPITARQLGITIPPTLGEYSVFTI